MWLKPFYGSGVFVRQIKWLIMTTEHDILIFRCSTEMKFWPLLRKRENIKKTLCSVSENCSNISLNLFINND